MILRKPYAFLIKHFKLINVVLSLLFLYLIFQTGNINGFFNDYVSAGYVTNEINIASTHMHIFVYLAIFLILVINIFIYFLMRQKEKSTKFYTGIIIFYFILFICAFLTSGALNTIEEGELSSQVARMFRDISFGIYPPQIFFFCYALLRGIGFDIKKFDFENDARDLEITDLDREEFEVVLGKNNYKYKRGWRRFRREFKYYFLENKFAFFFLLIILMVSVAGILYLNFGLYHKSYGEFQSMNHNGLSIKVVSSLLTNMHTNGKVIAKDKYYLAVAVDVKNNNLEDTRLDFENFKIMDNGNFIMPTLDRATYFPDLGLPYTRDMLIKSKEEAVYVLVYEVTDINQHYDLRILESLENTLIGITPIYKNIRLNYETIITKYDAKEYELGKILDLSDSVFNITELQIKNYSFTNNYTYKTKKCSSANICQDINKSISVDPTKYGANKKVLALDVFFQLDKTAYYYQSKKSSNSFINDFVLIRAKINGETKEYQVDSLTPSDLDNVWLLAVDNAVEKADKVDLLVTIHGKTYVMNLKDNQKD